jgi:hypothetical protein
MLKKAATMKTVPTAFKEPAVKEAFEVLEQGNWSVRELEAYDRYLDAIRSQKSQLETAIEDSELKLKRLIANKLLKTHDNATIAEITGLEIQEIEKLRE